MKLLGIEGSGSSLSLALQIDDSVIEVTHDGTQYSRYLLQSIDQLLAQASCSLASLDAIAYSAGPGSFTGLRITYAAIQALALVHDLPILPVSSLAVLAQTVVPALDPKQKIIVLLDAKKEALYYGEYCIIDSAECRHVRAVRADICVRVDEAMSLVKERAACYAGVGSGFDLPATTSFLERFLSIHSKATGKASSLLQLARLDYEVGRLKSVDEALPVYLSDPIAPCSRVSETDENRKSTTGITTQQS